jgi:acetyltransferase-like isoleucine patch superfamily enzyme
MRVFVRRLVRSPRTLVLVVADRFITPLWLRVLGVRVGRGCRFYGLPIIKMAPDASITLGDDVVIRSRQDSNPAGIAHPTILAALEAHSAIVVGAGTGISGASIVARRGVTIGDRVLIGAGACVWDTDFHPVDPQQRRRHQTRDAASAPVHIGDEAFVGGRSLVLKGVSIGPRAVVAAGAVVAKDVAADTIVGGNPARVLGTVPSLLEGEYVS